MSLHIFTLLPWLGDVAILTQISIECKFISNLMVQSKCGMVENVFEYAFRAFNFTILFSKYLSCKYIKRSVNRVV